MTDFLEFLDLDPETQRYIVLLVRDIALFLLGAIVSPLAGRFLLRSIETILKLVPELQDDLERQRLLRPNKNALMVTGTALFLAVCLNLLLKYPDLYTFLGFFIYLTLSIGIVWLFSNIARRILRRTLIDLMQRWVGEVNEVILVIETLIYFLVAVLAAIIFAQGLRLNLFALGASLGIGGVAVAFAGQQALSRLIGTLELYLDRPYIPGEYIRVTFNPYGEDVYGRVESIGLRSTKIRTVAQNTLIVVPNSMMAGMNIENISRGKKLMAMLCLDFSRALKESEQALVRSSIEETSRAFWGLEQAGVRVHFCLQDANANTRARVNFFITGSGENSLNLRKRLLELANEAIAKKLATYNLLFSTRDPMVYVDSPMSI